MSERHYSRDELKILRDRRRENARNLYINRIINCIPKPKGWIDMSDNPWKDIEPEIADLLYEDKETFHMRDWQNFETLEAQCAFLAGFEAATRGVWSLVNADRLDHGDGRPSAIVARASNIQRQTAEEILKALNLAARRARQ